MTTSRLAKGEHSSAPEDEAERRRHWIERGNEQLLDAGRDDLHWVCRNGHYSIERR